jgi:hypothetical protein
LLIVGARIENQKSKIKNPPLESCRDADHSRALRGILSNQKSKIKNRKSTVGILPRRKPFPRAARHSFKSKIKNPPLESCRDADHSRALRGIL